MFSSSVTVGKLLNDAVFIQQGAEEETIRATAASLLGEPAQSLGTLGGALPECMDVVEKLRLELETEWGLLQTRGKNLPGEHECLEVMT